jgi:hypothetical protein
MKGGCDLNGFARSQDPFNIFVILILLGLGVQFLYAGRRPFTGVTGSAPKSSPAVPADAPAPDEQPEPAADQEPETVPAGQLPEDEQEAGRIGVSIAMESPPSLLPAGLPETRERYQSFVSQF